MSNLNNPETLLNMPDGTTLAFESNKYVHVKKIDGIWTVIGIDDEGWEMDDTIPSQQLACQDCLAPLDTEEE